MRKQIIFTSKDTALFDRAQLQMAADGHNLAAEIMRLQQARSDGYQTRYASMNAPFDIDVYAQISELVAQKRALNPTVLIVVGIGGSSLGAKAIQEALLGRYYNAGVPTVRIYFAQTVDADRTATIIAVMKEEIAKGNHVLVNVITKSGTTTETIANFQVLLALLQQSYPERYRDFVVVTTDKDSILWRIARQEQYALLEVPQLVGGRYSVFTAVGLFPLMLLGIDCEQLCKGAQAAVIQCMSDDLFTNPAALGALIMFLHYKAGLTIHDLFLFSVDLEGIGKWYRQLLAESIGKEKNIHGAAVFAGITPTVSLGSIDLHSVAQLYLGGPRDKLTTFVTVEKAQHEEVVPHSTLFDEPFKQLTGLSFAEIMDAIICGTKAAYMSSKRPFCSVVLPEKNAYYLGQFLQMKMIETMYLGYLMEVDPFDQPNVELYKRETKKLLEHSTAFTS